VNSRNTTLGDFVQQLLLRLGDTQLHFKHERPWHELFYRLKIGPDGPGKPDFLREMFFDWNAEYPKCQELSEYLHTLHWTGCMAAANPAYDRFRLNREIGGLWESQVDRDLAVFIEGAAENAKRDLAVP
jgi:hypothetical protein